MGRLALLVLAGLFVTATVFPWCSQAARRRLKSSWAIALLDSLGVEVEADLTHVTPGALVVANHVSWIDIYVINAALPSAFVAKAEIRQWPVIGWLAAKNDTIFLRRGSRGHARIINDEIAAVLASGQHVAVFPEGTTTDGRSLLHFHAALLQPALTAGRPVLPVAISYWEVDGERSMAPRYDGDISLGQCARAILGRRRLIARLVTTPLRGLHGEDRRQVAAEAREAIALGARLPLATPELEFRPEHAAAQSPHRQAAGSI
ncbi:MAG: lyso-ornithine lipid acyltransferase [Proteobacteria bacterium]|nr:lyso-ornithine lipid acyltransferase [Pseudomonadota bacterium]